MSEPIRFAPPRSSADQPSTPNLYVANCGPAVGVSHAQAASAFRAFGEVVAVHAADDTGARLVVCFSEPASARAAMVAWGGGRPCPELGGRKLHIRYSVFHTLPKINDSISVSLDASELGIPGIYLLHDFISIKEEQKLLAAVDAKPWENLSKRRVQHYGYEFLYETRNIDPKQYLGDLPSFVSFLLKRLTRFPIIIDAQRNIVNQLTVNEYPPGVGLAPHVDTHSAFYEYIFSLSLAGPCIMEFRKYSEGSGLPSSLAVAEPEIIGKNPIRCSNFIRKAIFLPPRSMLLMSGEGRYAWHHYIPHHKVDSVGDCMVRRSSRRVSFTFREVRREPCSCEYPQFCDSQTATVTSNVDKHSG